MFRKLQMIVKELFKYNKNFRKTKKIEDKLRKQNCLKISEKSRYA